ncbi:hypothetical protein [Actinomadura sp. HBU206391]|uniref:hypothetical protein n=1 Tax=Actinomadura sp. HBU206391 TaxID=2731692 RepID=UPI00164F7EFE|nr:hypothetical protein [Actinomadura sp. HBU206391]MBC6459085.1 hypothetical protein [Actinomadura sp. HBU206391]
MDTPASIPAPTACSVAPVLDRAEIKRFADTLAAIDRDAVPADPLGREIHLAVTELHRFGVSEPTNERLAELLVPLDRALAALSPAHVGRATPRALVELVLRVDDAKSLLETPDLGVVATEELAGRLRRLYGGIVSLRGASSRLHRAWRAASAGGEDR